MINLVVFSHLMFLSDEGPKLETLDYTIHIGSTLTFLYFDLYLYAAHYVYIQRNMRSLFFTLNKQMNPGPSLDS